MDTTGSVELIRWFVYEDVVGAITDKRFGEFRKSETHAVKRTALECFQLL